MSFPAPTPGLVIRYAFLWSNEKDSGSDEAAKDRPCAIVLATPRSASEVRVLVAPITHSPPADPLDSVAMPGDVASMLGLDSGAHWVRLDELNLFNWPGYDLRPIPGDPGRFDYGLMPNGLTLLILERIKERRSAKRGRTQVRDRNADSLRLARFA